MTKAQPPASAADTLLGRLRPNEYKGLTPHLQPVPFRVHDVLYEARAPIEYAYFPVSGVLSALAPMEDGRAIEVANVGFEGMIGLPAFLEAETSPNRLIVQVPGAGLRVEAEILRAETERDGPLRRLLIRYQAAFLMQVSQSVACNGLHIVQQRCCRWLLMTHDRVHSDSFSLTHEFLAFMLGVRRASVSEVLRPLQDKGLIRNVRGTFTILDRTGLESTACECYRSVRDEFERLMGVPAPKLRRAEG
jgi:CRP-like cAMP-binding protein